MLVERSAVKFMKCSKVQLGATKCRKRDTGLDRLAHAGKMPKHVYLLIG